MKVLDRPDRFLFIHKAIEAEIEELETQQMRAMDEQSYIKRILRLKRALYHLKFLGGWTK